MIEHFTVSTKQHVWHWQKYNTANRNQRSNRHLEDGQIIIRKIIDTAIDDSLRKPLTKKEIKDYRWSLEFKFSRGSKRWSKDRNNKLHDRYSSARRKLNEEDIRQSGIGFVTSEDFLGLYQYAYQSTGEFLQRELDKAYEVIRRDPDRSNYYRKIFNQMSGERIENDTERSLQNKN
jgi:hypothetical protein